MPEALVEIIVVVEDREYRTAIKHNVSSLTSIEQLIPELLVRLNVPWARERFSAWELVYQNRVLALETTIGSIPQHQAVEKLTFILRQVTSVSTLDDNDDELLLADSELESSDYDLALDDSEIAKLEECRSQVVALDEEEGSAAHASDDAVVEVDADAEADDECGEAVETPPQKRKAVTRRATVRYYNRMNPERVYPLLVVITKKMVERMLKADTDQKSTGPLKINLDTPLEIEPIIPGCTCYPAKMVTRLNQKDFTATFHVVPQVLGAIEGAVVVLRQGTAPLAEIALEIKVTRRLWVVLSGLLTFILPFLSGLAKHYRLDLQSQSADGFAFPLKIAQFCLDYSSPLTLAIGLAILTLLVYWFTRPQSKDVFWEIKTIGPDARLKAIAEDSKRDPEQAGEDLIELLKVYPEFQPAHIYLSEWHYQLKSYNHALRSYQNAFELGTARAIDYLRASLSASHLGRHRTALAILQKAEMVLPKKALSGVLLFNMGCYHTRLGSHAKAMQYLKRALLAGFRKKKSFLDDRDLDPLRSRSDFRALLKEVQNSHS